VSDIDIAVADSLKVLDLKWPIREATYGSTWQAIAISLFALKGVSRRRGSQGRVFATGKRGGALGFIRAIQRGAMALLTRRGLFGGGKAIPAPNGLRSSWDDWPASS
jgi:hypothetical protein